MEPLGNAGQFYQYLTEMILGNNLWEGDRLIHVRLLQDCIVHSVIRNIKKIE